MTSEIIQILIASTGVQTSVGRNTANDKWKVYPYVAPQKEAGPFITVRKSDTEVTGNYTCAGTLDFPAYEVRCWSKNQIQTEELHEATRVALETGNGIYMQNAQDGFSLESDMYVHIATYKAQETRTIT